MKGIGSLRRLFWVMMALAPAGMFLLVVTAPAQSANPKLAAMIKKASQEGTIVYQGPDPATGLRTQDMLRDMSAVTKKHFGVDIRVKIDNALSFPASTGKTLTEIKAGAPPTFDLMYQTELSGAPLYRENAVHPVPWLDLFSHLTPKDLEWHGMALVLTNYVLLPVYNTRAVKPRDVPKTWAQILDPKWKGKLGMPIYPDPWKILSQPDAWGEQRVFDYLKKLMKLNPKLGRFPQVHQNVISGETPLAWLSQRERTLFHKERRGAPIDVASEVEPVIVQTNVLFVPKGARHPNAAALVAAAMLTKEGQELELKYQNLTSMFRPNTPMSKYAASHKLIRVDMDFQLRKGSELSKKIREILIKK